MSDEPAPKPLNVKAALESWQDELESVALYKTLARLEESPELSEVYERLAKAEASHVDFWERRLREHGAEVPKTRHIRWRVRTLIWLAKRFGPKFILQAVSVRESVAGNAYGAEAAQTPDHMAATERKHARLIDAVSGSFDSGVQGDTLARLEGRHRTGGNALRAAVLGANDGLVSNLSLVMGVAGYSQGDGKAVLVAGLAGLIAGSLSMALGEWLSVQSSRELYQRQIAIEARELEEAPEEEAEELALIYQAKGIPEAQARELAQQIISNKDIALDTLVREELGIDPNELGGSAWEAGITSFILFATGAAIPVLPFFFVAGELGVLISVIASALGLFVLGAGITLMTGRSVLFSGTRQVLFGVVAAAITYGIGALLGVQLA